MIEWIPNPLVLPVGALVGVLIAAPVGPVNIICIQRAISRGVLGGIAAGLGAVLGDGLIALVAASGVGVLTRTIDAYFGAIQLIGGLAVMAFGAKLFLTEPRLEPPVQAGDDWGTLLDYAGDVPKTFFLTVTNPGAVLGLIAIFGGVSSFVEVRSHVDALAMVAAIMAGSLTWWVLLSLLVGRVRDRLDLGRIRIINRVAGALLLVFGAVLVGELVVKALWR